MEEEVDLSSKPFQGVVLCCTSIPPDQRTEIAQRTSDMGGIHKYDLTPDVTHLIVGDYDTPKYRHVAKERPDILPMAAGWIEDARNMWMADQEFDFAALEAKWKLKTFESGGGIPNSPDPAARERRRLLCCLTGFEDHDTRTMIEGKVKSNGGEYVGDLSRSVTHLITYKPEGKKYLAALRWDVRAVSIEWLNDSAERGMILNESCYDPTLPQEERGVGAWTRKEIRRDTTGKRLRDDAASVGAQNRRKLRKTASMKFNSQNENLWGDILNQPSPANQSAIVADDHLVNVSIFSLNNDSSIISLQEDSTAGADPAPPALPPPLPSNGHEQSVTTTAAAAEGIFASCRFFVHGFPSVRAAIIQEYLTSNGGQVCGSLSDVAASPRHAEPPPPRQRFLVVPQKSQPSTHPGLPPSSPSPSSTSSSSSSDGKNGNGAVHIVTEFYIERCVHGRRLCDPDDHVLGRPFPRFPIAAFAGLAICTTGFADERLNQVEKAVVQLGAAYAEKFSARASVLVAPGAACVPKLKADFARVNSIPLVDAGWLWQCIATGSRVPWDGFLLQELLERPAAADTSTSVAAADAQEKEKEKRKLQKTASEPVLPSRKPRPAQAGAGRRSSPSRSAWIDRSAFQNDGPVTMAAATSRKAKSPATSEQDISESHYETAPTHLLQDTEETEPGPDTAAAAAATSTALKESTSNVLNKSPPTPQKTSNAATAAVNNRKLKRIPTGGTIADSEAADDEEDDDDDNNNNNNTSQQTPTITSRRRRDTTTEEEPPPPPPPREEAARKRKQQQQQQQQQQRLDREKQERTAREKQEMAKRLNSLMSSHGSSSNGNGNGKNNSGGGGGSRGGNDENDSPGVSRRKREVLGRAISNVSAASSNASADSGANNNHSNNNNNNNDVNGSSSNGNSKAAMGAAGTGTGRTGSLGGSSSFMSAASGSGVVGVGGGNASGGLQQLFDKEATAEKPQEHAPPATQLEYDNPEARQHRAAVVERMLRGSSGSKKGGGGGGGEEEFAGNKRQSLERVKTLAGLDADAGVGGVGGVSAGITSSSSSSSGVAARRTSRRQKGF